MIIVHERSKNGPLACSSRIDNDILSIPFSELRSIVIRTASLQSNLLSGHARFKSAQVLTVSKDEFVYVSVPGEELMLTYISAPGAKEVKIRCWDLKDCQEAGSLTVPGSIVSRYRQLGSAFGSRIYYVCLVVEQCTGRYSAATTRRVFG